MRPSTLCTSLFISAVLVSSHPETLNVRGKGSARLPISVARVARQDQTGRHRARALDGRTKVPLINAEVFYTASVGVGSPPTLYTLAVDTGSSNTWIGAIKPYVPTSTSKPTGQNVSVSYGTGSFNGSEFIDEVVLSPELKVKQSIGVATSASIDFTGSGLDGILGLGPPDLTIGTLFPNVNETIPTVLDNLASQKIISQNLFGISFQPVIQNNTINITGEIDFGEVDRSKTISEITFTPITRASMADQYWGIDASFSLGDAKLLALTSGIVDTGTTNVLLPSSAYNRYVDAIGATFNDTIGALLVTKDQFLRIPPLHIRVNGADLVLTRDAQAYPQSLNAELGAEPDDILLVMEDLGPDDDLPFSFILGYAMLERYYSVFDAQNSKVGFASTPHTFDVTNVLL